MIRSMPRGVAPAALALLAMAIVILPKSAVALADTTQPAGAAELPMPASTDSWVLSSGDVRLRVHEYGPPADSASTVVLVHGYLSTSRAWDQVVARLAPNYHVVTYDTRGNGESDHPARQENYALPVLAADIGAVIDATAGGRRVHLVGWDWGAGEGWEAAATPAVAAELLDFTALSGPNLDLWGRWLARTAQNPADLPAVLDQAARSVYIPLWNIPIVAEAMWNTGITGATLDAFIQWEGAPAPHVPPADGIAALNRYRANVFQRLADPTYSRLIVRDVHVIVAVHDLYVGIPVMTRAIEGAADHLTFTEIDSGHWAPITDAQQVADAIVGGFSPQPEGTP